MKTLATAAAISLLMAGTALATNPPPNNPPQQQNQGQGQFQGQGQAQGQQQRAYGGAGGAGGAGGNGTGGSQTQSQGTTVNNNGGGGYPGNYGGPGTFPASSAYAPSYALGSMCQEAWSAGASAFFFGLSGGQVKTLEFCKSMMQAGHFRSIGREDMAKLLECNYPDFRDAYKSSGTPCRVDVPKEQQPTTPIVQPTPLTPATPVTPIVGQQQVLNAGGLKCIDAAGRPVALGQPGSVRCQ